MQYAGPATADSGRAQTFQIVKITYTSPIRAHHFSYAQALERAEALGAFVTGAFRGSKRAQMPELGNRLIRRDLIQTAHLASIMAQAPDGLSNWLGRMANRRLDQASYRLARQSDVFLHYRTSGYFTTKRLHQEGSSTLCVMEEVNTHVDRCHELMKEEYEKLELGPYRGKFQDHDLRLRAYEEVDLILCPSSFVRRSFLEKGFPAERLLMVNFGFTHRPTGNTRPAAAKDPGIFRMLYVGQLNFRKGLRYALEAFRRLQHPRKEFVIVGPRTKVTGLENVSLPVGVTFAGVLKGTDLEKAYASATVFVLPTLEEGLSLVLGEAMVAALPVVTTTHSGGDDLIQNGIEGFVVAPAEPDQMLEALQKLADSPELCERMGRAALARSCELGDWDATAGKLVTALSAELKARGSR